MICNIKRIQNRQNLPKMNQKHKISNNYMSVLDINKLQHMKKQLSR